MAKFTIISKQDFDRFFAERIEHNWQPVQLDGVHEMVYGRRVAPMVDGQRAARAATLRVYTSVVAGESRSKGKDAIRVCLFQRGEDGAIRLVGGDRRVHRVEGWRKNLGERLDNWMELTGPDCPKCGKMMANRKSKYGHFWGCSDYPNCKGIINTPSPSATVG